MNKSKNIALKLYRGVNLNMDGLNGGLILPSGQNRLVTALADGSIKADGTFLCGPCLTNNARAQQVRTGLYGASGISTTRNETVAISFATASFTNPGIVYVLDGSSMAEVNIELIEFENSRVPEHQEVTIILDPNFNHLPTKFIIEKYYVGPDGKRMESPPQLEPFNIHQ